MQYRQPGKTLQHHARFTGRTAWIVLALALIVSMLFLYIAFDTLLKSFGNRADPVRTVVLFVGV
ncbi:MAG: hypothetical protein NZ843_06775, partial [Fimbriimonadales bacterium]|nr:hypothetical protein [Fimbriimonadales bacterium]